MTRHPLSLMLLAVLGACAGESGKQRNPVPSDTDGGDADTDGGDTDTDTDGAETGELVGLHDGVYTVTVQRAGDHFGIGKVTVERNALVAGFTSNSALEVTVEGTVATDGTILTGSITAVPEAEIEVVEARFIGDVVEATYLIDGEEGALVGTRDGRLVDQTPVRDFDGSYALSMVRDDEEVAATVIDIRRGRFRTNITSAGLETFEAAGFVTSDGVIVLSDETSSGVIAEASIDQDSGEIEGIYLAGTRVGRIAGRRSD